MQQQLPVVRVRVEVSNMLVRLEGSIYSGHVVLYWSRIALSLVGEKVFINRQ